MTTTMEAPIKLLASDLKKGMVIRTTRPVIEYRGRQGNLKPFPEMEVRHYRVEAVYRDRNSVKLSAAGPLAYGCVMRLDAFPGAIEIEE